jgi:hypothetical protein
MCMSHIRSFVLIMLISLMLFVLTHKLIDVEERVERFRCVFFMIS